jgi:hypothetical protein
MWRLNLQNYAIKIQSYTQLTELRHENTKLKSEMKLNSQQLKKHEDGNKETITHKEAPSRILNRLESIDRNRWFKCRKNSSLM